MARRLRIEYPGALHHVMNRGNYRRDLFESAGAVEAFLRVLFEAAGPRRGFDQVGAGRLAVRALEGGLGRGSAPTRKVRARSRLTPEETEMETGSGRRDPGRHRGPRSAGLPIIFILAVPITSEATCMPEKIAKTNQTPPDPVGRSLGEAWVEGLSDRSDGE